MAVETKTSAICQSCARAAHAISGTMSKWHVPGYDALMRAAICSISALISGDAARPFWLRLPRQTCGAWRTARGRGGGTTIGQPMRHAACCVCTLHGAWPCCMHGHVACACCK
eukprot:4500209-Prymnesium_polylepis.1